MWGMTQQVMPMSPSPKIQCFFSLPAPFSHHGMRAAGTVPRAATHIPGAPKASPAITVHWFLGLGSGNQGIPSCQWGARGEEGEGSEVALISKSSKSPPCPLAPLCALSSRHSVGTAGAGRQCCASSKLIGIVTCLPLFVRAPASLRL